MGRLIGTGILGTGAACSLACASSLCRIGIASGDGGWGRRIGRVAGSGTLSSFERKRGVATSGGVILRKAKIGRKPAKNRLKLRARRRKAKRRTKSRLAAKAIKVQPTMIQPCVGGPY